MTKFVSSEALTNLLQKLKGAIIGGKWLSVRRGDGNGCVVLGRDDGKATGRWAVVEGQTCEASGDGCHAEGSSTKALSANAHSEGWLSEARGNSSHAEGSVTVASGNASHAEGARNSASGEASHAEGYSSSAWGNYSHAEGSISKAKGYVSHAEGLNTIAYSTASHAEGRETVAGSESDTDETGGTQHAEGYKTKAVAVRSHAEGSETQALGYASHAEGLRTIARGYRSHTEGQDTCILSTGGHAQGMANYHTNDLNVIHDIGIGTVVDSTDTDGTPTVTRLSAEVTLHTEDDKNGYKYLIGVGHYYGQEIGTADSVQEVIANLADEIHGKVTWKRPYGQIVIGKSINPMSYLFETWYAFLGNPSITVWSDNETDTFNVYVNDASVGTISSDGIGKVNQDRAQYSHFLRFKGVAGFYQMAKEYTKGDKDIYLKYVEHNPNNNKGGLPHNLTGTSKTYSWNNGKRVTNKKGTFEQACNAIKKFLEVGYAGNYRKVYKMCRTSKNQNFRKKFPEGKKHHTKFTRLSHTPLLDEYGGLYLVKFWDRNYVHMNDVKVYVRVGKGEKLIFRKT